MTRTTRGPRSRTLAERVTDGLTRIRGARRFQARASLPALVALLASGCASVEREDWRFAISREFYGEMWDKMDAGESYEAPGFPPGEGMEFVALAVAFALPLALDLCVLPVTAFRDHMVDRRIAQRDDDD